VSDTIWSGCVEPFHKVILGRPMSFHRIVRKLQRLRAACSNADGVGQAIILAAGCRSRLKGAIGNRPKCLADIDGETLLDQQLRLLESAGRDIFLVVGYQHDAVRGLASAGRGGARRGATLLQGARTTSFGARA
jgi:hypothetical protein